MKRWRPALHIDFVNLRSVVCKLARHIFGWLARLVSRDNSVGQAKLSIWKGLHGGPRDEHL
jgi:hypothetical protein